MSRNVYPFAINTYSYTLSHTAKSCLTHLAEQGYTDFELMMYPGHLWPADMDQGARDDLRRHIAARNLRVITLNMPNIDLNIAAAAAEMRAYTLGLLRGVVELAGDLEVPGVVIGPGKFNPLFPAPKEIVFECSCPDWAGMCKHVAATLYGVGARLDRDPALFFALRGVDTEDLISRTVATKAESLLEKAARKSSRVIAESDLSRIFGIDFAGGAEASTAGGGSGRRSRVGRGGTAVGKAPDRIAVSGNSMEIQKPAQVMKSKSLPTKKPTAKHRVRASKQAAKKFAKKPS